MTLPNRIHVRQNGDSTSFGYWDDEPMQGSVVYVPEPVWRGMADAPTDGTLILVIFDEGEMIVASSLGDGWWSAASEESWHGSYARAWMPLPAPPKDGGA